jgi:hypothetical protein
VTPLCNKFLLIILYYEMTAEGMVGALIQSFLACGLYVKYDSACFRICSLLACGPVGCFQIVS